MIKEIWFVMSRELNGDGCITYAGEVPGTLDDGSDYNSIVPDKVTAFQNMSSIPVKDDPRNKTSDIRYLGLDLTYDQKVDIITEASLKLLDEKYNIKPSNFIDSSDKYLPCNMHHFEHEIVDIINELSDKFDVDDINNLPTCVLMVTEILHKYSEDIAIRDELKTNKTISYGFQLLQKLVTNTLKI